jgi:hypothetical protein
MANQLLNQQNQMLRDITNQVDSMTTTDELKAAKVEA